MKTTKNVDNITLPQKKEGKKEKIEVEFKKVPQVRPKRKVLILACMGSAFIFFITTLLLAPFVHAKIYEGKVLPGVYVLGEEMGGRYEGELKKIVREKLENNKFVFKTADKEQTAEFQDMGLSVDFIKLSDKALTKGNDGKFFENEKIRYKSLLFRISPSLAGKYFSKIGVDLDYTIDESKLKSFVNKLSEGMGTSEKNAGIVIKGTDVEVIPAKYGEKILSDSLDQQIKGSIAQLKDGKKMVLGVSSEKIMPSIQDTNLKNSIDKAKVMINSEISLFYNDKNYKPSKEIIASWVVFQENGQNLDPKLDSVKIDDYLKKIAKEIDVAARPKKVRIENGVKETVTEEGANGLAVDVAANRDIIIAKVQAGEAVTAGLITKVLNPSVKTERVLVADWTKYIEVDIANQKLTAYENQQPIFSDSIATGKSGFGTPVGTFLIYGKTALQDYKGGRPGTKDYYYLPNVHWSSWFNGPIAIHEAYWRRTFGGQDYKWNGSHGCVNVTLSTAKWVFDWAPIGTPVIVH